MINLRLLASKMKYNFKWKMRKAKASVESGASLISALMRKAMQELKSSVE